MLLIFLMSLYRRNHVFDYFEMFRGHPPLILQKGTPLTVGSPPLIYQWVTPNIIMSSPITSGSLIGPICLLTSLCHNDTCTTIQLGNSVFCLNSKAVHGRIHTHAYMLTDFWLICLVISNLMGHIS